MRIALLTTLLILGAMAAHAGTIDRDLASGVVTIKARAAESSPDLLDPVSLGVRRTDTGDLVFCVSINAGETISGESNPIANTGAEVLLQAFTFSGDSCQGRESPGSETLYRIVFGAPGRPELLPVE